MIERLFLKTGRPQRPPLRVGLLLDSYQIMAPFAAVIDHLRAADFVDLRLVVLHDREPEAPLVPPPWASFLPRKLGLALHPQLRPHLLYTLYQKYDRRQNAAAAGRLDPVDCTERLAGVPSLRVRPLGRRFVHRFPDDALAEIGRHDLDVMLRFGFNILRGGILQAARHGIWSYHHGDNDYYRGGPAHFWEMVERNPVSGVMLQRLTEELDGGLVFTKLQAPTLSFTSEAVNRVAPYAGAETFVIRKLWELHTHGPEHLEKQAVPPAPYRGRQKIYQRPGNRAMASFMLSTAGRVARSRMQKFPQNQWRIAIAPAGGSVHAPLRWITPPGRIQADPFPVDWQGQSWVFFEEFDTALQRGYLAACPLTPGGEPGPAVPVLRRDYHLSYPFLWQEQGELFMIPESKDCGQVQLLRCRRFPDDWVRERVLFEGPAVDTTLVKHDGRYWFFTSLLERPGVEQLYLFSAPSLFDAWQYHPANPVSLDIRNSRCGGALFQRDGSLIRVAQDGSHRYGCGLRFQRVTVLNEREYREEEQEVWPAERFQLRNLHTFNQSEHWQFADGQ